MKVMQSVLHSQKKQGGLSLQKIPIEIHARNAVFTQDVTTQTIRAFTVLGSADRPGH